VVSGARLKDRVVVDTLFCQHSQFAGEIHELARPVLRSEAPSRSITSLASFAGVSENNCWVTRRRTPRQQRYFFPSPAGFEVRPCEWLLTGPRMPAVLRRDSSHRQVFLKTTSTALPFGEVA
jgi:hypothetical protein